MRSLISQEICQVTFGYHYFVMLKIVGLKVDVNKILSCKQSQTILFKLPTANKYRENLRWH
jgi:hypothetical protein